MEEGKFLGLQVLRSALQEEGAPPPQLSLHPQLWFWFFWPGNRISSQWAYRGLVVQCQEQQLVPLKLPLPSQDCQALEHLLLEMDLAQKSALGAVTGS
jgi:hypothetical protein